MWRRLALAALLLCAGHAHAIAWAQATVDGLALTRHDVSGGFLDTPFPPFVVVPPGSGAGASVNYTLTVHVDGFDNAPSGDGGCFGVPFNFFQCWHPPASGPEFAELHLVVGWVPFGVPPLATSGPETDSLVLTHSGTLSTSGSLGVSLFNPTDQPQVFQLNVNAYGYVVASPVPEPGVSALLLTGLAALGLRRRTMLRS